MERRESNSESLDTGLLLWGFLIGLAAGALAALFRTPQSGDATRQQISSTLRSRLEAAVPVDPVAESMAEGKAAARRRRAELGLDKPR